MEFMSLVFVIIIFFALRFFGAWMFRINDVISLQKEILEELRKLNNLANKY